jgi:hypothetical protein
LEYFGVIAHETFNPNWKNVQEFKRLYIHTHIYIYLKSTFQLQHLRCEAPTLWSASLAVGLIWPVSALKEVELSDLSGFRGLFFGFSLALNAARGNNVEVAGFWSLNSCGSGRGKSMGKGLECFNCSGLR